MLIKDLKGIFSSKVNLMHEKFVDVEKELHGMFTIDELIEKGYGESEISEVFAFRNELQIVIK